MNFPVWEVPLVGSGVVIAAISIIHVFLAHFAVGGGLWLVLAEQKAYRDGDSTMLLHVRARARFFILITLVLGAASGVGIWFAISAAAGDATAYLLRVFLWAWAIEWVLFLVEITAAFVYYHGWDRLDRRAHLTVGWIYFIAAWLSLAVINGILTFMLTPGTWTTTHELADAIFNPTYFPSLMLRTLSAIALAGLYAMFAASSEKDDALRERLVGYAGLWLMLAFLLMPVIGFWFFRNVPEAARDIATGGAPPVMIFLGLSILFSILIFGFSYFCAVQRPRLMNPALAVLLALVGFLVTATSEWVREAIRKPYVIYDTMYANSIPTAEAGNIRERGALSSAPWAREARSEYEIGREVFRLQCIACHTESGYNGIDYLTQGWPRREIDACLEALDTRKGYMPPFLGTDAERRALAQYLDSLDGEESE